MVDNMADLDKTSVNIRKLYFLRNSVRTIDEIVKAVDDLQKHINIETTTLKLSDTVKNQFKDFFNMISDRKKEIKILRNNLWGGHVGEPAMKKTLNQMHIDRKGLLEYKETMKSTRIYSECRYKFAGELILAHNLDATHPDDQERVLGALIGRIAQLTGASVSMIDNIFALYARERRLVSE